MNHKILVTDSLFIFEEHLAKLKDAGYDVERLDTPTATQDQLIEAVKGKIGYILGGIERVTDAVIEAADELKVIVFTGADYQQFIPGWQKAKEKGIMIVNCPGSNVHAVSEFAVGAAIAMQRNLFELGRTGTRTFETTVSLAGSVIGVVGAGRIGSKIIAITHAFEPADVMYWSREEKPVDARYSGFEELAESSDIIFVAIPESSGRIFDSRIISKFKKDALIVSVSPIGLFDEAELLTRLQNDTLRFAYDYPAPSETYLRLPLHTWFNTNSHTAYNTHQANKVASDRAVESIINVLTTGNDQNRVV